MNIQELQKAYAKLPQVSALAKELGKVSVKTIFLDGLLGSSAPMLFGSLAAKCKVPLLFILQDDEEAVNLFREAVDEQVPRRKPPGAFLVRFHHMDILFHRHIAGWRGQA